ncbi:terminase large subunit [Klebsiella phage vB_KpM_FBKp24]|uniref:Terminase large subunit n=1 Tax=Klebsiella phage vB_KpM_FBKp24 TaxID=2801834 RepID=A0A7U0GB82_9CAUD|nr:hypothetical protein [Klebsiella pneumoniae]YP_010298751.1 terminase large subunit [Klebsiella phage vB_KpM_FBKp24]QQV92011.1 terminase large subunit [Klebsiella phage vB_KpM_FBKp24]
MSIHNTMENDSRPILHLEDWDYHPSAIPDWDTPNKEFTRFVGVLQKMGIKNHHWPLALLNPDLVGVDPFSPNLTEDQMIAIKIEAEYNIWYYLRECLRVPPVVGEEGDLLRANRANMSLIWSYMNHIDYLLIQPRQTGKSLISYCLYSWLLYMRYTKARISLVTKSDELRSETTTMIRRIREYLPPYLTVTDRSDTIANEKVTYNTRGNLFAVAVSRSDPGGANKVGRGNTSPTVGWDETPFINYIEIAFKAAMPGMNAAIEKAKARNMPWGSIMTTTAGDQTSRDGRFVFKMWNEAARWSDHFYDAGSQANLREVVQRNLKSKDAKLLINGTWSHNQVGVSDEQHYENMRRAMARGPEADRDFFNIWTAAGTNNPIDKELLAKAIGSQRYSDYSEIFRNGYIVHWYVPKEYIDEHRKTMTFIIGADTSEGGGRDALSLVFLDPYSADVIGVSVINEALIPKYAEFLGDLLISYPKAVFIPERKSTGQTFIDYLCLILHSKGIDPFKRIYNSIVDNKSVDTASYMEIQGDMNRRDDAFYIRRKTKFGFCTGTTTRRQLYETVLKIAMLKGATRIHDKILIAELTGLIEKNGKIDHPPGGHDDTVIAYLLTVYLLIYGANLDYYGLDSRRVLTGAVDVLAGNANEIDEQQEEIDFLHREIEKLLTAMETADNPISAMKLERRLNYLNECLEEAGAEPINVTGKIEEINSNRHAEFQKYMGTNYYR